MRALRILAIAGGGLIGLLVLVFGALQTPPGQRAAAALISQAASGPAGGLDLVGLSGFLPVDLEIARITYRDRDGPWLTADNVRLRWSFASLLRGSLEIETLGADRVTVLRAPLPDKASPDGAAGGRPRLPVGIDLRALAIGDLHLAAALVPTESHWKVAGSAKVPADLGQGRLVVEADRLDGPTGRLAADFRFDAGRGAVDGEASLTEGRGGVVATLLERPDIDALAMRLVARGDARAGNAELTVSAGDAARVNGTARWEPRSDATAVSVKLDTAGPGLPQGPVADAIRQPMALNARATVGDKVVTLDEATVTAGSLAIDASARYDRVAGRLAGTVTAHADEPGGLGPLVGGVAWRSLHIEAKADLAALATRPEGTIVVTGGAEEIVLAAIDSRLPAVGSVTLAANLGVGDGRITVKSLDVGSPVASLKGEGGYLPATGVGEAKASVAVPDLAPLSALAGTPLAGKATIEVAAKTDPDGLALDWRGKLNDLSANGLPPQLVTAQVDFSGAATWRHDETWSLRDVRVAGEGGIFTLAGRGRAATGDLDLSLELPKLALLRPEVTGAAKASGRIELRGDRTDLNLEAEISDLGTGQFKSRRVSLAASGSLEAAGAASGTVKANGDLAGQALSLDGRFARDAAGGIVVPSFHGRWASAALDVDDLAVTNGRSSGTARLRIARLADFATLAGTALAGSLDADISADDRAPKGRVTVHLSGTDLRAGTLAVGALDLRTTVDDPMASATTDATLSASRIAGAADINRLTGTATGNRQALVVAMQASGAQTQASLAAKVELAGEGMVIGLTRLDGRYLGIPVTLAAPTRFHMAGPRIVVEPTNLRLGGGRLTIQGTLAPTASDLRLELAGLPLSLIDAVAPGTNLDGALQAKLQVTGSSDAPTVNGTYGVAGLRLRRPEAALLPPVTVQGSGSLTGSQAAIDARLGGGGATSLSVKAKATLPRGATPLSGSASITGMIDVAPFAPLLGNDVRNVTGKLRPELTLEFAGPRVTGSGTIDLTNGAVSMPESGLRLSGGEGRLSLQGDTLQIQRLVFQTARGGGVGASGTLRFDAQQGIVPDIAVTSRNALLVSRPDLVASLTSDLKVTGSTVGGIDIAGPVTIDRAEIAVGAQQTTAYPTLEVREVNKPGGPASGGVVAAGPPPRTPPPAGATPIRLKLSIRAPQAVFVRGRGLDAELAGQLEVGGTPAAPSVTGGLTLRRGDFNLLGRRLTFSRGMVTLDNLDRIDPRLDFVASTTVQSNTINVVISGTSRAPLIAVTSVPPLPQDEAMALLLFGKPASGLSAFELAQAAQGVAELTGESPGSGVMSRVRTSLGLDRLSVGSTGTGANAPVSVEAGRYVAPGVYVGARQGATGNSSRGVVQVDVLEHVKIEGDVGADSNGRVGVKFEWDY